MIDLVLDGVAAYRLTRLVTTDTITQPVRHRLHAAVESAEAGPVVEKLATLVTCPWCVGVWAGFGVTLARQTWRGWPTVARALTVASAAAWLAQLEPRKR